MGDVELCDVEGRVVTGGEAVKCGICGRRCVKQESDSGREYWSCPEHGAQAWVEVDDEHRKRSA